DGTSRNVVAWWPNALKYGLVVGAHMDTVRHSPGANDNASGVAVLLEMARISAGRSPARFVRFVAFGAEEYGTNGQHHNGSWVYVNRLRRKGRQRLGGMVSIDMIAKGRPLIAATTGMAPRVTARTVYNKMRAKVRMSYQITCDCSDNGPFERAGIPSVFLWSGFEPNHHEPTDTVRNLKPKDIKRTGRGFRHFLKQVDGSMIRRFRRAR
ncbi:MAG: M28 family metallopeptidase, partial [Actinomycetota bacterium]